MEVLAVLLILVIAFFALFAAFPYLLLFAFILLPRVIPLVRRIPLKWYLLADAIICLAAAVAVTLTTGLHPLEFTMACFGGLLFFNFAVILPPLLTALFAAAAFNLAGLYRTTLRDAPEFKFKPILTASVSAAAAVLYFVFVAIF